MYLNLTLSTWQMIMKKPRICPIIGLCFMSNSLVISCNTSIYWEHWVASRRLKGPLDEKKNAQKFIGFDCNLSKVKGVSREKPSSCNSLHAMSFFLTPFGLSLLCLIFKAFLFKFNFLGFWSYVCRLSIGLDNYFWLWLVSYDITWQKSLDYNFTGKFFELARIFVLSIYQIIYLSL